MIRRCLSLLELESELNGGACDDPRALFARLAYEGRLDLPLPGSGETRSRFAALRMLGRHELSLARLAEGHADGLAILAEADVEAPEGRLGVWAAGPLEALVATPIGSGWQLHGTRRWCSGAPDLTHGLVRAAAPDGDRLFLVPLDHPGIHPVEGSWPAIAMAASDTLDVEFDRVDLLGSAAIGGPGFYVGRSGFWYGAAGVAAVWLGGSEAVAAQAARASGNDPHRLAHLGWIVSRLAALGALLDAVAELIDAGTAHGDRLEQSVQMLRAEVARSATEVIDRTGRVTGPGPLAHDRAYAQRVADLTLYVRQSHAEADLERIGHLELAHSLDGRC